MEDLDWGNILFQAVIYWLFFKLGQASIIAVESNFSEDEIKQMVKDAIEVFGDKKHADNQTRQ